MNKKDILNIAEFGKYLGLTAQEWDIRFYAEQTIEHLNDLSEETRGVLEKIYEEQILYLRERFDL